MTKLKIFISYKTKQKVLKNDILQPIQTGRAITKERIENTIGDDDGDNISKLNPKYNELSAQYWVWKHYKEVGNPDYVGFMHNRRHFIFDPELKHLPYVWLPKSRFYFLKEIYDGYINHFSEEKILPYLEDNPNCISFRQVNIKPVTNQNNMKDHFYKGLPGQKKEVFETLEKIVKQYYPKYSKTFDDFKKGTIMYCCNSFIMPKSLFFEYSEFLFNILKKIDEETDSSDFDEKEIRFLGFCGEYLLSIFLMEKLKNSNFKLKELAGTFICDDYKTFERRIKKYKFLSKVTFGKKKRYYIKKYINYKRRLEGK